MADAPSVCGQSKDTVLYSAPDLTVSLWEFNGVVPAESAFKGPLQNATSHCMAYHRVLQGKFSGTAACLWTDARATRLLARLSTFPISRASTRFSLAPGSGKASAAGARTL